MIRTAKHDCTEPERVQQATLSAKQAMGKRARTEAWDNVTRVRIQIEEAAKKEPKVNVSLNIGYSDYLVKAKRRMEEALMDDFISKIKIFKI